MTRLRSQRKQEYMMNLSIKRKQCLKDLVHPLKPVVMLGNNGLTEGVLAEIGQALEYHRLIEVKIASEDRDIKTLIVEAIVRETGAYNVQVIGKTLVLYRSTKERKTSSPRQEYPKVAHEIYVKRGVFRQQESKMLCSLR